MQLTKHYFPGGNTCNGFVNYFDGIVAPWTSNNRCYVLKGGPGVGKNTFMKRFSELAKERGYAVEHFHCASDSKSLDAIHIPSLGVTMLDGTAPHSIDPVTPGAVDEILNLGRFLDNQGLEGKKEEIIRLMQENSRGYKHTFAYLGAAGKLQENTDYIYKCALDSEELRNEVQDLFGTHDLKIGKHNGTMRHLFAEAYTPQGYVDYFNTIVEEEQIISLHGPKAVASEYIKLALHFARFMGYGCEVFYSCLLPQCPIHLIVKDLGLCITTNLAFTRQIEKIIDLESLLNPALMETYNSTITLNDRYKKQLIDVAIESLLHTKGIHDKIEEIYMQYMAFDQLSEYTDRFMDDFFK